VLTIFESLDVIPNQGLLMADKDGDVFCCEINGGELFTGYIIYSIMESMNK